MKYLLCLPIAASLVALGGAARSAQLLTRQAQFESGRSGQTGNRSEADFASVCGTRLCRRGKAFSIKGGTAYGGYNAPHSALSSAINGRLNTIELVEFDAEHQQLSDTESRSTWARVDRIVASAASAHLGVILNLSEFGQSLQAAGLTMSSPSWQPRWDQYLRFIATRVNSVTRIRYRNDPTIVMVELWGEIPAPNYSNPVGTSQQIENFYRASFAYWKRIAPKLLVSSGGFSYLNDQNSGLPWRSVMRDPNNATCDIEINSASDRAVTVPLVTRYCRALGKPWFLSAWSACDEPSQGSSDIRDFFTGGSLATTDAKMAKHAMDMYRIALGDDPAGYPAVGTDFWNLGSAASNTCELGPQFPRTWSVIRDARVA